MKLLASLLVAVGICTPFAFANGKVELQASRPKPRPILGVHFNFADGPNEVIREMRRPDLHETLFSILRDCGAEDLRMSFHGYYSHLGPEATEKLKRETRLPNQFRWFPIEDYIRFIKRYRLTTVLGINVEEGPDVAVDLLERFKQAEALDLITSVEFGNEPFLSERPWPPEEYAERSAEIIRRIRPYGRKLAIALTVGKDRRNPLRIPGNEYTERVLKTLAKHIDLNSDDLYGVIHLYSKGVSAKTVEQFNKIVRKYSKMKYQVTEYNIRLWMSKNPHLTVEYALEFARKLNQLIVHEDITGLWIHSFPYHSLVYWTDGEVATVVGFRDPKLKDLTPGWHLTPAGQVHGYYQKWAWNGSILAFLDKDKEQYWAVESPEGTLISVLNTRNSTLRKQLKFRGQTLRVEVPARSIVTYRLDGTIAAKLVL
ncbi:MAG: hypothetical protein RMM17_11685 [Acidobacteriota bacterium]|nr:hypothetical protein [Blastocatellia bacterium]MDW8413334.1 hypothetical protein [Acidobacteriota bacterium]